MNEATTTKLLWTTAACSPRSAASNTFYPNMFPSFPAGKFPLISTHSAYPRAPDPLFASHPLNHAVQAAVPFVAVGASADALAKRIEKELAGTELFYYVVKCSLLDLLDGGFVGAHVANAGAGGVSGADGRPNSDRITLPDPRIYSSFWNACDLIRGTAGRLARDLAGRSRLRRRVFRTAHLVADQGYVRDLWIGRQKRRRRTAMDR